MKPPTVDPVEEALNAVIEGAKKSDGRLSLLLRALLKHRVDGLTPQEVCLECKVNSDRPAEWAKCEVERLRKRANTSRKGGGQHLDVYFDIPKLSKDGRYRLLVRPNLPPESAEGLWWPYLKRRGQGDPTAPDTSVVITEPYFFRHSTDQFYIRHFEVNTPNPSDLLEKMPALQTMSGFFEESPHFVSLGEVRGALKIMEGLRLLSPSIPTQLKSHRELAGSTSDNVILLGTSRANLAISNLQNSARSLHYRHTTAGVGSREGQILRDTQDEYYAVFTRINDHKTAHVTSVIACNHGPATRAVAEYLFSPSVKSELIPKMQLKGDWKGFPLDFQVLFQVTVRSSTLAHVDFVDWKPIEMGRSV